MRELDEEAAGRRPVTTAEERGVPLGDGTGAGSIADAQSPGDLAVTASGQRDDALVLRLEQLVPEAGHGLRPGHVRPGDHPAQAAPADRGPREQHEVWAARPVADAAEVLLDRIAVTGKLRPPGPRSGRPALGHQWLRRRGFGAAPARSTPWRDDDGIGIRHGRIEQADLRADDPMQSGLLGGTHEPHRAVQAVVVGDGQSAQAVGHSTFDQIVRRRGPVEEREVGVGVELGVGDGRHSGRLDRTRWRGLTIIEQMFTVRTRNKSGGFGVSWACTHPSSSIARSDRSP